MHIPDGFVNAPVAISTGVLALGAFAYAVRRTGKVLPASRTALLGVSAAFIFAAQMLNFPVAAGTSGHLIGGVLAAVLLGPSAAVIALSAVVLLQCFVYADGGVTALGANLFNLAVIAPMVGYAVYRAMLGVVRGNVAVAAGIGGWVSTMVASAACAGQIAMSGKAAPGLIMPAMLGVHALIGVGEGLITALVVAGIARSRPELLQLGARATEARLGAVPVPARASLGPVLVFGTLIAAALAMFVAPFASPLPDGLERVAEDLGFHAAAIEPILPALMPDYEVGRIASETISTAVAGLLGTIALLVAGLIAARLILASRATPEPVEADTGASR